jgi:hypothetical protein
MFTKLVLPIPGAPEISSLSDWSGFDLRRSAFRINTSATLPACPTKSVGQDGTKQVRGMGGGLRGIAGRLSSTGVEDQIGDGLSTLAVEHHSQ